MFGIDESFLKEILPSLLTKQEVAAKNKLIIIVGNSRQEDIANQILDKFYRNPKVNLHEKGLGRIETNDGYRFFLIKSEFLGHQVRGLRVGEISFVN